ncbi:MAG: MBOAT family O-acyltransferase [Brevefilum sp.]|nr:MBOAT family O-acyltransferase [Brevefilum sp.]
MFSWVDFKNLPLLILFVVLNYLLGRLLGYLQSHDHPNLPRWVVWAAAGLNLIFLGFYKYLGFFIQIFQGISEVEVSIEKPALILGLSYLTFSSLSYLFDVYQQAREPEKNFLKFCAYLVMFPKLVQGPIALYKDLSPQLADVTFNLDDIAWGVRRFMIGLAKKVLIADSLAIVARKVFATDPQRLGAGVAWFGLIAYTLVIYFDFAGYTDMALGIGRMFGFRLPENFNNPYISRSITDFWRRWHMSLTNWFRAYVFIPLEFKRRRSKFLRQQINILIVFALTGLWHGASWNFLIWGVYFGVILAIEASGVGKFIKKWPRVFQHIYAMLIVMIGWVFFRISNIQNWGPFFRALFGFNGFTHVETLRTLNILFYIPILMVAILLCFPLLSKLERRSHVVSKEKHLLVDVVIFGIFLLSVSYILSNGFQVFMYVRF